MELPELESQLPEWAFVEVMGHSKICGRLNAVKLGMAVMLQVNVLKPEGEGFAYSKLYSPASLFSITPVDRDYCARWAKARSEYDVPPVPYLQPEPAAKQLGTGTTINPSDDFFQWCADNGHAEISDGWPHVDPKVLHETLELYAARHERDHDKHEEHSDYDAD